MLEKFENLVYIGKILLHILLNCQYFVYVNWWFILFKFTCLEFSLGRQSPQDNLHFCYCPEKPNFAEDTNSLHQCSSIVCRMRFSGGFRKVKYVCRTQKQKIPVKLLKKFILVCCENNSYQKMCRKFFSWLYIAADIKRLKNTALNKSDLICTFKYSWSKLFNCSKKKVSNKVLNQKTKNVLKKFFYKSKKTIEYQTSCVGHFA